MLKHVKKRKNNQKFKNICFGRTDGPMDQPTDQGVESHARD